MFRTVQYAKVNHSSTTSEREQAGTLRRGSGQASHRPYGFLLQHLITRLGIAQGVHWAKKTPESLDWRQRKTSQYTLAPGACLHQTKLHLRCANKL